MERIFWRQGLACDKNISFNLLRGNQTSTLQHHGNTLVLSCVEPIKILKTFLKTHKNDAKKLEWHSKSALKMTDMQILLGIHRYCYIWYSMRYSSSGIIIIGWGWVGCEEFCRLRTSKIYKILPIVQKANLIIVLLFHENNSKFKDKLKHANLGWHKFRSIMLLYREV